AQQHIQDRCPRPANLYASATCPMLHSQPMALELQKGLVARQLICRKPSRRQNQPAFCISFDLLHQFQHPALVWVETTRSATFGRPVLRDTSQTGPKQALWNPPSRIRPSETAPKPVLLKILYISIDRKGVLWRDDRTHIRVHSDGKNPIQKW